MYDMDAAMGGGETACGATVDADWSLSLVFPVNKMPITTRMGIDTSQPTELGLGVTRTVRRPRRRRGRRTT